MNKNITLFLFLFFLAPILLNAADISGNSKTAAVKQVVSVPTQESTYLAGAINSEAYPKAISAPNTFSTIFNLLLSVLFIIGLIYLVTAGIKFFYVRASIPMKSKNVVNVIAKEYLDSKTTMYVVEFANKLVLLGHTGGHLNPLTEITDKETIEQVKQQADQFVAKFKIKSESRFDEELKSSYLKQGKKIVDGGNEMIKGLMDKLKKKDKP
jgi:flagellar biogenesis protein FliO